jgi:hypothetical protein
MSKIRVAVFADDLALLALRSKKKSDRLEAGELLASAATAAKPLHKREEIAEMIMACPGAAYSPFLLSPEFRDIAVDLVQLALSKKHGANRFRIASEDTIGTAGGLTIHKSGKSHYLLPTRKVRRSRSKAFFVAPGEALSRNATASLSTSADLNLDWDGEGYSMTVSKGFTERHIGDCLNALQNHSYLGGSKETFESLGLRIKSRKGGSLQILTGSPTALLRFTAHCAKPTVLVLASKQRSEGGGLASFTIPSLDALPLKVPLRRERIPLPWANVPIPIHAKAESALAALAMRTFGRVDYKPEETQ